MKDKIVQIKEDWMGAGRIGKCLGDAVEVHGMMWLPLVWDDEEDPEFFKLSGIDFVD